MRVVYSSSHLLHNPDTEVQFGVPIPMYEVPARAEAIRRALEADGGFGLGPPTTHGTEAIEAVHEPAMVRYLAEAWSDWRRAFTTPQAIPGSQEPNNHNGAPGRKRGPFPQLAGLAGSTRSGPESRPIQATDAGVAQ